MRNNYGFIKSEVTEKDYIFGDAQLQVDILQPDGQWDAYLPEDEFQNKGFEIYACATFGTLNCAETILKRRFGFKENFSDRYIAKLTGTDKLHGNDPQKIAEFIRNNGDVDEAIWPYDNTSFENYYSTPPATLSTKAKVFNSHYAFGHDYVPNDPKSMMSALKYSPIGISVYAWVDRGDGIQKAGDGQSDNHWVMVYGYVENEYWKVFDSYDNTHKKLEWKHRPMQAKRYHIDLAPQTVSLLDALRTALKVASEWLQSLVKSQQNEAKDPPSPAPVSVPVSKPQTARLLDFCKAIRNHEGWYHGSRSWRNNNPGNCKYSSEGYAVMYGTVGIDKEGFAVFPTYALGWLYLQNLVKGKIKGHPEWSLHDFFSIYAPAFENDVLAYVKSVADYIKVDARTFLIKNLI